MIRLAYLVFMAVLAASLCGCGGGHDEGYLFDGDWDGTFSDSRVSSADGLTLHVSTSNPSAPPSEREYTFTGEISSTTSEPPALVSWEIIGSMSGSINSRGNIGVQYSYGSDPSSRATGQVYVVYRPSPDGTPHMIGSVSTYGNGTLLAQQEFDLTPQDRVKTNGDTL